MNADELAKLVAKAAHGSGMFETWDGLGDLETFPCLPRVKARELGMEVTDA